MTLHLNLGTKPDGLPIKSGFGKILIGDYQLTMEDFAAMVRYVIRNTDLQEDDPRIELVEQIKKLRIVEGFGIRDYPNPNLDSKRYVFE